MQTTFMLLCLFLVACDRIDAQTVFLPDAATLDERMAISSIVNEVQTFSDARGFGLQFSDVPISLVQQFSESAPAPDAIGLCYMRSRRIEILKKIANDPEILWDTVVHELGHCVLGRSHDDFHIDFDQRCAFIVRGNEEFKRSYYEPVPASVMTVEMGRRIAPRGYYLEELFGLGQPTLSCLVANHSDQVRYIPCP